MQKVLILLILININMKLFGQSNLVPNPSFEIHDTCPDFVAQIQRASGWMSLNFTPDYFHACSSYPGASVPYNFVGYQNSIVSGDSAYAGLITSLLFSQTRDLIGTFLSQPLEIGKKYYLSFCIVSGSQPSLSPCRNNKFGLKFVTYLASLGPTSLSVIDNFSHYSIDSIVTDTLNWTCFRSSFFADSAYTGLLFGNFYTVDSIRYSCVYAGPARSYYYIDKICVSEDSLTCTLLNGTNIIHPQDDILIEITENEIRVRLNEGRIRNAMIYDLSGRIVFSNKIYPGINLININHLAQGMYILKINAFTYKFIL